MRERLRVGACQVLEFLGDVEAALACVEDFAGRADRLDVDLLVFPACFLQGSLVEAEHVRRHAADLGSPEFGFVLQRLRAVKQTLVIGATERQGNRYCNTAVVIAGGELVGAYRKIHLMPGESLFDPGDAYPTFHANGVQFGINICSDTQFAEAAAEAAAAVAAQGARVLLVPAQNMLRRESAQRWKDEHHRIRAQRARETGMWLVSADVTGERDEDRVGYGPTSVINPHGELVAQVPLMTTGIVTAGIR